LTQEDWQLIDSMEANAPADELLELRLAAHEDFEEQYGIEVMRPLHVLGMMEAVSDVRGWLQNFQQTFSDDWESALSYERALRFVSEFQAEIGLTFKPLLGQPELFGSTKEHHAAYAHHLNWHDLKSTITSQLALIKPSFLLQLTNGVNLGRFYNPRNSNTPPRESKSFAYLASLTELIDEIEEDGIQNGNNYGGELFDYDELAATTTLGTSVRVLLLATATALPPDSVDHIIQDVLVRHR